MTNVYLLDMNKRPLMPCHNSGLMIKEEYRKCLKSKK